MKPKHILIAILILFSTGISYSLDSIRVSLNDAMWELENKNYEEAVKLFNYYIAGNSGNNEAYYQRGNAHYELGHCDNAITDYTRAHEMGFDKKPIMYYRLGMCYENKKDYLTAASYFERAVALDSRFTEAYFELGNTYYLGEDYDRAKQSFLTLLSLDEEASTAKLFAALGDISMKTQSYSDAIDYYQKAIKKDSNNVNVDYHYAMAMAYYGLNDTISTITSLKTTVELDPGYAKGYYGLAAIYGNSEQYDLVVENLSKAISSGESSLSKSYMHKLRGLAYQNLGDTNNAMIDFNEAITLNSKDTAAYSLRGIIYYVRKNDSLAMTDFTNAIKLNPNEAKSLLYRGMIYMNSQKIDLAINDLSRAVELTPDDTLTLFTIGNLYLDQDKYPEAIRYYTKALTVNPKYHVIFENRGIANYNMGFYKQAAADFESAMRFNPALKDKLGPLYWDAKSR